MVSQNWNREFSAPFCVCVCVLFIMDNTYRTKKTLGDRAFENAAPKVWNRLPLEIRQCQSLKIFKVLLKTHLFKLAFY